METRQLTSVHEALNNAIFATKPKTIDIVSVRLDAEAKAHAAVICERHGTNLSEFLRQCVLGLLNDYSDPSRG